MCEEEQQQFQGYPIWLLESFELLKNVAIVGLVIWLVLLGGGLRWHLVGQVAVRCPLSADKMHVVSDASGASAVYAVRLKRQGEDSGTSWWLQQDDCQINGQDADR